MTFPLHHCSATGCNELVAPGSFLCAHHHRMVPGERARQIVCSRTEASQKAFEQLAILDIAVLEGRIENPFPLDPDYIGTDADHLPIIPVFAIQPQEELIS